MKTIFNTLLIIALAQTQVLAQTVEIQCLANMGVSIRSKDVYMTIDAFFHQEFDYLGVLPPAELDTFASGASPYTNLDVILATHLHGDHFDSGLSGRHLQANQGATLISTHEALKGLESPARTHKVSPKVGQDTVLFINNIRIVALGTSHLGTPPWNQAQNNAYLITLEGQTILHFGDGAVTTENLKYFADKDSIDLAILPLSAAVKEEQKRLINSYIKPKRLLIAHIPPQSFNQAKTHLEALFGYELILFEEKKRIVLD